MITSGLRIGTPALATRGFGDAEFTEVADIIALALLPGADVPALRARVAALTDAFPCTPAWSSSTRPGIHRRRPRPFRETATERRKGG